MKKTGYRLIVVIFLITIILFSCFILFGCSSQKDRQDTAIPTTPPHFDYGYYAEEAVNLVYVYPEIYSDAPDKERVIEALNQMTKEKINVTVTMESYPHATITSKINSKIADNQQMDLFRSHRMLASLAARNAIAPLDNLLMQYGRDLLAQENYNFMKFNDVTYGIACSAADFGYYCLLINAKMAKEFGVEEMIKKVKRFEDMEDIYKIVHQKNPYIKCYIPSGYNNSAFQGYSITDGIETISHLGDGLGVILNNDNRNIVNFYETPEYKKLLEISRNFYLKGYFPPSAAFTDVNRDVQYQSEEGFSVMNHHWALKRDAPYLVSGNEFFGIDSWVIPLSTLFIDSRMLGISISASSKYKEAAMAWLNLVSTDKETYQLLSYGIEGEHYIKNDNGTIRLPEGCDSIADTGYETSHYFLMGDSRNRLVWDTISDDPNYYDKLMEYNNDIIFSNTLGFVYDDHMVADEVDACKKVVQKYTMALESGALDPETELPKFIAELKDVGIDTIIREKQRQLDHWLKTKEMRK